MQLSKEEILLEEWKLSPATHVFYKDGKYSPKLLPQRNFKEWVLASTEDGETVIHEVIPPGYPVRLFLDIEMEKKELIPEECEALFARLLIDVRDTFIIETKRDKKSLGVPIILDASKYPTKFSVHVVFPNAWFIDSGHLGRFIRPIATRYPPKFIDIGVYRENSISQLRLPYTSRPSDPTRVFRPRKGPKKLTAWDWEFFVKCCVGCTIATPEEDLISFGEQEPKRQRSFGGGGGGGGGDGIPYDEVNRVIGYLEIIHGPVRIQNTRSGDGIGSWTCKVFPGLFCETRAREKGDGYHQQTSTIIGKDSYGKLYYMCMDDQCRTRQYFRENVGMLLLK